MSIDELEVARIYEYVNDTRIGCYHHKRIEIDNEFISVYTACDNLQDSLSFSELSLQFCYKKLQEEGVQ